MKKKTRNILLSVLTGALLLCAIAGGTVYYYLFAPQFHPSKTVYVYVDRDDTADSIYNKPVMSTNSPDFNGWQNIENSTRIYIPDVMPSAPTKTYTMYSAASSEVIRNR